MQLTQQSPPQGAYARLDDLLAARFAARDLDLRRRRPALNQLTGPNKSSFRGRGIDFEEVRGYQPGDDIRSIDWRVTARSGTAHTKVFREERERPLLLAVDQRQPMFFGSHHCFKSVLASHTASLLAWAGLKQGDRVGGLVFGNEAVEEIRPARSRRSVMNLLRRLEDYGARLNRDSGVGLSPGATLARALTELRRVARPGSAVYLISDFSGFGDAAAQKQLHQLARHCEITALFCVDPMERELPPPGDYLVSDGMHRRALNAADKTLRRQFRQRFAEHLSQLRHELGSLGIPLIELDTDHAPLARLALYYAGGR